MRLFIAVQLSPEMQAELLRLQWEFRNRGGSGIPTLPENLHLTLAFIGELEDPGRVTSALSGLRFSSFEISLSAPGSFGNLLWAGVARNPALEALVLCIRERLSKHGIPCDTRPFLPHITLIKKSQSPETLPMPHPVSMTVSRISLMRSEFRRDGVSYAEIACIASGGEAI